MPHSHFEFQKLCDEFQKSAVRYSSPPEDDGISEVDFRLAPPCGGKMKWFVSVNGRESLICEICCQYPEFGRIRDWMMRALAYNCIGGRNPEYLTLDCIDYVSRIKLEHSGWEKYSDRRCGRGPVAQSRILIVNGDSGRTVANCYCLTNITVCRMYRSLMDGLLKYSRQLESPSIWPACRSYRIRYGTSLAHIYRDELRCPEVEDLERSIR